MRYRSLKPFLRCIASSYTGFRFGKIFQLSRSIHAVSACCLFVEIFKEIIQNSLELGEKFQPEVRHRLQVWTIFSTLLFALVAKVIADVDVGGNRMLDHHVLASFLVQGCCVLSNIVGDSASFCSIECGLIGGLVQQTVL
jgi:hypothetical protein